ncbi:MAG: nuclear transport factor 2 family protein [Gammaproteobacteria bacterium]|nr:nuclear transport factor 2 family protein [Gammaproteobacteria bacterium]
MKKQNILLVLLFLSVIPTHVLAGKAEKIATKSVNNWNYALKSRHVDAIMRIYAKNAMLVESNGNIHNDSGRIREFWKKIIDKPEAYEFNLTEAHQDGNSIVMTAKLGMVDGKDGISMDLSAFDGSETIQQVLQYSGNGEWKTVVQQWN